MIGGAGEHEIVISNYLYCTVSTGNGNAGWVLSFLRCKVSFFDVVVV